MTTPLRVALLIFVGVWLATGLAIVVAYLGWAFRDLARGIAEHVLVAVGLMWRPATGAARWRWQR